MTNKVDTYMTESGPDVYYDPSFRSVIEAHMTYLRTHPETTTLVLDETKLGTLYKYEYDLYGMLTELGIERKHHWIVMRMNNFFSPYELSLKIQTLLIPNGTAIEQIIQAHKSSRKVT